MAVAAPLLPLGAGAAALAIGTGILAGKAFEKAFDLAVDGMRAGSRSPSSETGGNGNGNGGGDPFTGLPWPGGIDDTTGETGTQATVVPQRDPLVLDLDGDGIETTGRLDPVVTFDHDGDGVKTGTGWIRPDDGWLVRDLNANGSIDTGAELFGRRCKIHPTA
jgi:hypothetical protein